MNVGIFLVPFVPVGAGFCTYAAPACRKRAALEVYASGDSFEVGRILAATMLTGITAWTRQVAIVAGVVDL